MFDWNTYPKIDAANDNAIDKEISRLTKAYNNPKLKHALHVLICACVEHGVQHNSFAKLTNLIVRLPASVNKDGIKMFLEEYTSAKWLQNKDKVKMFLGRDADGKTSFYYKPEMFDNPFYDMAKVKAKQDAVFTTSARLFSIIKQGEKAYKDGAVSPEEYEHELLNLLAKSLPGAIAEAKAIVAKKKAGAATDSNVHQLEAPALQATG